MHLSEKITNREIIFDGKIFTVARDDVLLENGQSAFRELVIHNGGAGILPVDNECNVTLVRQYRSGVAKKMTEICAGKLEKGESPFDCAVRELEEELGLKAKNVIELGTIAATPAYDSEIIYIYLATELESVPSHTDDGEFLDVIKMPLSDALDLVMLGELEDAKTQIAILKAERILNGKA